MGSYLRSAAPVLVVVGFLSATMAAFFFGPFDWPVADRTQVAAFLIALVGLIALAGSSAHWVEPRPARIPSLTIFRIGALASCLLVFPAVYVYTGKLPWQIGEALARQDLAYYGLQDQLAGQSSWLRWAVVGFRMAFAPFVSAAVVLGILIWHRMGWADRALLGGCILSSVLFSIFRGTDREILDLAILGSAAVAVLWVRAKPGPVFRRSAMALAVVGVVFVGIAGSVFIERKVQRFELDGTGIAQVCVDRRICSNPEWGAGLGDRGRFAAHMVSAYAGQGYYGLAMALEMPFHSTLGFGHSPLAARVYTALTGDPDLIDQSYTSRLRTERQWSDQSQWSTAIVWLANDVGFFGALVIIAGFAFLLTVSWRDAALAGNDAGAVMFGFLAQFFIWMPANNQLMQSGDSLVAVGVWVLLWVLTRIGSRPREITAQARSSVV